MEAAHDGIRVPHPVELTPSQQELYSRVQGEISAINKLPIVSQIDSFPGTYITHTDRNVAMQDLPKLFDVFEQEADEIPENMKDERIVRKRFLDEYKFNMTKGIFVKDAQVQYSKSTQNPDIYLVRVINFTDPDYILGENLVYAPSVSELKKHIQSHYSSRKLR